jgi:hypothetical protein
VKFLRRRLGPIEPPPNVSKQRRSEKKSQISDDAAISDDREAGNGLQVAPDFSNRTIALMMFSIHP